MRPTATTGILMLLFVAAPPTSAATYFVATGGADGNDGSEGRPFATLQHAADTVAEGDLVIVRPGSYAGFDLRTSGASGAPIVFRADAGVVIDRDNGTTPDGINLEGVSYVEIEGFTANGRTRAGFRAVTCDHVTFRGNTADQNGRWGIFTGFCDDLLLERNTTSRSGEEHGIYTSNSGDRPVLRHNVSWGNNGCGIHMNGDASMGGDGVISGALVEQNVIYDNGSGGGSGINCDGVMDSVIRNNLLYDNHASGISLYQGDGADSGGNLVINNTVTMSDGRWCLNIQSGSTGNRVFNNILWNGHASRGAIDISADSLEGFTSDFNIVIDRFTTDGGTGIDLAAWRSATGQDAHSLVSTPDELFVAPAGNDYHLAATSPAIDVGTGADAPAVDLEDHARPSGAAVDIGAYEYVVGGPDADADADADGDADADADAGGDGDADTGGDADADGSADADVTTEGAGDGPNDGAEVGGDDGGGGCSCRATAGSRSAGSVVVAFLVLVGTGLLRRGRYTSSG